MIRDLFGTIPLTHRVVKIPQMGPNFDVIGGDGDLFGLASHLERLQLGLSLHGQTILLDFEVLRLSADVRPGQSDRDWGDLFTRR